MLRWLVVVGCPIWASVCRGLPLSCIAPTNLPHRGPAAYHSQHFLTNLSTQNQRQQHLDWEHILIKYQFVFWFRKTNLCYISGDCVAASLNMGHLTGVVFPFVIEPWLPLLLLTIVRNLLDEKLSNEDIVPLYIRWQIIPLCQFVKTQ